jgi:hypothetical protein
VTIFHLPSKSYAKDLPSHSRRPLTSHLSLLTSPHLPYHASRYGFLRLSWRHRSIAPFYSLLGEAAATLLGLLFVSVTFNRQILESAPGTAQRRYAENIFRQFVFLVWLSLTMLLPMTPLELGFNLLLQSLCFFIWIFVGFCRSFLPSRVSRDRSWWRNYLLNFATYLGAAWAGCLLLGPGSEPSSSFSFLITVSFLALFSGLYGVWRLMVGGSDRSSDTRYQIANSE